MSGHHLPFRLSRKCSKLIISAALPPRSRASSCASDSFRLGPPGPRHYDLGVCFKSSLLLLLLLLLLLEARGNSAHLQERRPRRPSKLPAHHPPVKLVQNLVHHLEKQDLRFSRQEWLYRSENSKRVLAESGWCQWAYRTTDTHNHRCETSFSIHRNNITWSSKCVRWGASQPDPISDGVPSSAFHIQRSVRRHLYRLSYQIRSEQWVDIESWSVQGSFAGWSLFSITVQPVLQYSHAHPARKETGEAGLHLGARWQFQRMLLASVCWWRHRDLKQCPRRTNAHRHFCCMVCLVGYGNKAGQVLLIRSGET